VRPPAALAGAFAFLVGFAAATQSAVDRSADTTHVREVNVEAGAVATALVSVPAPGDVRTASYRLVAAEGIRLFGAPTGELIWDGEATVVVPVTFSVPRTAAAGRRPAVHMTVAWPDGEWRAGLVADVQPRHALTARFETTLTTVARGGDGELFAEIVNDGNVEERVAAKLSLPPGWLLLDSIRAVTVAPGGTAPLALRIRAPASSVVGESQAIVLVVRPETPPAVTTVRVRDARADDARWITLSGTAFVGASDVGDGRGEGIDAGVALGGSVSADSHLTLVFNRVGSAWTGTALRRELTGPALRAELRRPGLDMAAGDVYRLASPIAGGVLRAVGASGAVQLGAFGAEWLAGRPGYTDSGTLPGHLGWLRLSQAIGSGRAQLTVADLDQPADALARGRARTVLGGYRLSPGAGHDVVLEAGATAVASVSGMHDAGPAAQAQYRFGRDGVHAEMRLRAAPVTLPGSPAGTEAYAGAGGGIGDALSLAVWMLDNRTRAREGDDLQFSSSGLSLRYAAHGVQAHVTTSASRNRGGTGLFGGSEQIALAGGLVLPVAALHLDVGGQLAHVTARLGAGITSFGSARIGWFDGGDWLALSALRQATQFGASTTALELGGARGVGAFAIEGGAGIDLDARRWTERSRGWIGVSRQMAPGTRLLAGLDYQPWRTAGTPLRLSVGVRQAIAPLLPMRRPPVAAGVIFDDLNGNGRRDPGEPPLEGVDVNSGLSVVTTDENGRFAFFDAGAAARIEIDPRSLPDGMMLPGRSGASARGRLELGVVRTADLTLAVVLDSLAATHTPAPEGVTITIVHEAGTTRVVSTAADGTARLPALLPGSHTLTIYPVGGAPGLDAALGLEPAVMPVIVEPGETRRMVVVAPFRAREIRLRGGASLSSAGNFTPPQR
jgi:hypothetical protein